ncbi:hypothetical protein Hsw_3427 [Hymenobacter swuensis DY53]|uniref:Teneurin NHL domain-containing protein n=1 Tax=Hymenobacter swuensis DY53 TaxID=1227739 RepID=W8F4T0_9BACT|nr:hypothetical protein Hsw_3427 [Hymenobacter swuensis DY53]
MYTTVKTLAGNGIDGFANGLGTIAQFNGPEGAAVDNQGNVYVADTGNNCIRKITPTGEVTTLAGGSAEGFVNGPAASARFYGPIDVALDGGGNLLVADYANHCIRKITPAGVVSTFAGTGVAGYTDGNASKAQFNGPSGLTVDEQGTVYVADGENYCIRKITAAGIVSTLAGNGTRGFADGPGSTAQFRGPEGLVLDRKGTLYVADFAGYRIRKVTTNGTVSTVAGTGIRGYADGAGNTAQFAAPTGVTFDSQGNLYVADTGNNCVRKITPAGEVSTVAGTRTMGFADGTVDKAQFINPSGLTIDTKGTLYLTEYGHRIRTITPE